MKKNVHIHLDLLGGISGDMFIASMIDMDSKLKIIALDTAKKILKESNLDIKRIQKNHIEGTSLSTSIKHLDQQNHRSYPDIVELINKSKIDKDTKDLAIIMFTKLAKVESKIHGTSIQEVKFHEIGAWDSIIDNLISAKFINYLNKKYQPTWSCSEIPLGKGVINSKHGIIPIPSPATALLLKNLVVIDDGISGERVTPTGALILSVINPHPNISSANNNCLKIKKQGIGIGKRDFKLIPNIIRVLLFEESKSLIKNTEKQILSELTFNIDDQTPEDISISLERIRSTKGVLEVIQNTFFGKKNRIIFEIKVLCRTEETNNIIIEIFNETSTIGVRNNIIGRYSLKRNISRKDSFNIKHTLRPSGKITKKIESDDLKNYPYKKRRTIKERLEK